MGKGVPYLQNIRSQYKTGKITQTQLAEKIRQAQIDNSFYRDGNRINPYYTGRYETRTLKEKLALEEAFMSPHKGQTINIVMNDPKGNWYAAHGWVKMRQNINGVEVHYIRNLKTGQATNFKVK